VNAYLVGYAPFDLEDPWVPLYAMALRLKYQLDRKRYAGIPDVWQTSKEAFFSYLLTNLLPAPADTRHQFLGRGYPGPEKILDIKWCLVFGIPYEQIEASRPAQSMSAAA